MTDNCFQLSTVGFRALVEENVKVNVARIAADETVISVWLPYYTEEFIAERTLPQLYRNETGSARPFYIHGWVYDIENGEVRDLGVSVGPPGQNIPQVPFKLVTAAARRAAGHAH